MEKSTQKILKLLLIYNQKDHQKITLNFVDVANYANLKSAELQKFEDSTSYEVPSSL